MFAGRAQADDVLSKAYSETFQQTAKSRAEMFERHAEIGRTYERVGQVVEAAKDHLSERRQADADPKNWKRNQALWELSLALPKCLNDGDGSRSLAPDSQDSVYCMNDIAVTIAEVIKRLGARSAEASYEYRGEVGSYGVIPLGTKVTRHELDYRVESSPGLSIHCAYKTAKGSRVSFPGDTPWCGLKASASALNQAAAVNKP